MNTGNAARPLQRFAWVFLVLMLSGGTAYALDGHNTVFTDDIVNGEVSTADIGDGQVRSVDVANDTTGFGLKGADVANGSLSGADIKESTLGRVPEALTAALGGTGISTQVHGCDPESETLITCATVPLTLPGPGRVLLIGRVRAITDGGQSVGYGSCNFGTNFSGPLTSSSVPIFVDNTFLEQVPLVAVTSVIGPDSVSFGIDCNEDDIAGGIHYDFISLTAVALSAN
jgi:hypothetical protein